MDATQLSLAEEFVLLAHDERGGKPLLSDERIGLILAAATLSELALSGRIELDEDSGLQVVDATPSGDEELDQALTRIDGFGHVCTPATWLGLLYSPARRPQVLERLAARGILSAVRRRRVLFVVERYQEADPGYERELRDRIRATLEEGDWPSDRTAAIVALAHGSGLAERLFTGADRRRIELVVSGDWVGQALATYYRQDKGTLETLLSVVGDVLS